MRRDRAGPRPPVALVAGALLLAAAGCGRGADGAAERPPTAEVSVGITRLRAEVADTPERRERGLGGRERLAEGRALLFPFERAARHPFWMKDMRFDIDIVWIRGDRVVDLHSAVPHDAPGPLRTYRPDVPADLVLEVPAGTAERHGWAAGDPVRVDPPVRASAPR